MLGRPGLSDLGTLISFRVNRSGVKISTGIVVAGAAVLLFCLTTQQISPN